MTGDGVARAADTVEAVDEPGSGSGIDIIGLVDVIYGARYGCAV